MTTGQEIIDRALDLTELAGTVQATAWATRIQHIVNDGLSKLHYILADGDYDWFAESADITVVAGTAAYALPDGALYSAAPKFYKMRKLHLVMNDHLYDVPKFQRHEIGGYETAPQIGGTVRLLYIPAFQPLEVTGLASWADQEVDAQLPPGWEDYVSLHLAIRLSIKEERAERAQMLAGERDYALQQILAHVTPRDAGTPDRMEDVSPRWVPKDVWDAFRPSYKYRIEGPNLVIMTPSVTS